MTKQFKVGDYVEYNGQRLRVEGVDLGSSSGEYLLEDEGCVPTGTLLIEYSNFRNILKIKSNGYIVKQQGYITFIPFTLQIVDSAPEDIISAWMNWAGEGDSIHEEV